MTQGSDHEAVTHDTVTPMPRVAPRRKGRKRRFVALVVLCLLIVGSVLAGAGYSMLGRSLQAPEWVLARFEDRAAEILQGGTLQVSQANLIVTKDLVPNVQFRDVVLRDVEGRPLIELADVQATVSRTAAMRGELELKRLDLSGLIISLKRDEEGEFILALGQEGRTQQDPLTLAQMIEQLKELLDQPQFAQLLGLDVQGATLDYSDAQSGRRWVADGGRISLSPDADAIRLRTDFAVLTGPTNVTTLEASIDVPRGAGRVAIGVNVDDIPARDIALQSPALAWLSVLDASLSASMRFDLDEDGALGPLFGKLEIAEGALAPEDAIRAIPFSSARAYFNYDPLQNLVRFDEVAVDSETLTAVASGHAYLRDLNSGVPSTLLGQFAFNTLKVNPEGIYPEPLSIGPARLDMRLRLDPFRVDVGQFVISPDGAPMVLKGRVDAGETEWTVALDADVGQTSIANLLPLWPVSIASKTRDWLAENLTAANLPKADLAFRLQGDSAPRFAMTLPFEDAALRFMKTMPPIENAAGYVSLADGALTVMADAGTVQASKGGRLDVSGTSFQLPELGGKFPRAEVDLQTNGTVTATLAILDVDPLNFISKANQPLDVVDGRLKANTQLSFVLGKKLDLSDIDFASTGTAFDVRSTKLVPNRTISAKSLKLSVDKAALVINGGLRFGGVPVQGEWTQPLGAAGKKGSQVAARVELSQAFLEEFKIGLPAGTISGTTQADLLLDLRPDQPVRFDLTSNLKGAHVQLRDLGWNKPANGAGRLSISGQLGSPPQIEKLSVSSDELELNGRVELNANGSLKSARFANLRVGQWLNAPVTLTGRGKNTPPAITVRGGRADLSKAEFGRGGGTGQGGPLDLQLDRVQISEGIRLTDFNGKFSGQGAFSGTFSARVNGDAVIAGTLAPSQNGTAIRIKSDNAGRLLKSAKLLKNAKGGGFDLTLRPTGAKGTYDGQLKVNNTRIQNAPALAQLLSAISIVGLLDQMSESGILFSEVLANFRLSPKQLILSQSSATGPSMGISMDGFYALSSGAMDMQGVLSPLFAVNGIGQIFTRRGEGLIGFNFNLNGTAEAPRVQVNPLSILTPGMFRELFRRPPPELK